AARPPPRNDAAAQDGTPAIGLLPTQVWHRDPARFCGSLWPACQGWLLDGPRRRRGADAQRHLTSGSAVADLFRARLSRNSLYVGTAPNELGTMRLHGRGLRDSKARSADLAIIPAGPLQPRPNTTHVPRLEIA